MKDDEIIRALRVHTGDEADCAECPYYDCGDCRSVELHTDMLTLITEQEKEIERFKAENEALKSDLINTECNLQHITSERNSKIKQTKIEILEMLKARCELIGAILLTETYIDELLEEAKAE